MFRVSREIILEKLRRCFREPIPEIMDVARFLDAAVSAHQQGRKELARELFALADNKMVREWVYSIIGAKSPYIHYHPDSSATPVPQEDRAKSRMPTKEEENFIWQRDGFHCRFCGIPVIRVNVRQRIVKAYPETVYWAKENDKRHAGLFTLWAQYDHVVPHARGGSDDIDNIVLTCTACNFGRMSYTLEEVSLIDPRLFEPKKND